jgi:Arc/MetJ-type ribon-helix-helix transcriptional regulator
MASELRRTVEGGQYASTSEVIREAVREWTRNRERPGSFPARDDISPGLRSAVHGRYLLLSRELRDEVRIVRIVHGARDLRGAPGL